MRPRKKVLIAQLAESLERESRAVEREAEALTLEEQARAQEKGLRDRLRQLDADLAAAVQNVDPYIRSVLLGIKAVDQNADLCFIGPDGCTTHPGFIMKDGGCGVAWMRSWLYVRGAEGSDDVAGICAVLVDGYDTVTGMNTAKTVLAEALTLWLANAGDQADWGVRHKTRTGQALLVAAKGS
jgi:hypothetical protein